LFTWTPDRMVYSVNQAVQALRALVTSPTQPSTGTIYTGCRSGGWLTRPTATMPVVAALLVAQYRTHCASVYVGQLAHTGDMSVTAWLGRNPQPAPYAFDVYSLFGVPPTNSLSGAPRMPVGVTRFS
jgi:hypothetical protein